MGANTEPLRDAVVSFDDEPLILVDGANQVQGYASKAQCHAGSGLLHRAFSIFIFNQAGHLLLQQRSDEKQLWPLYWSNSCCSHPRRGETTSAAATRRLREELNLDTPLHYLYEFTYHAYFKDIGAEREWCAVFTGYHDGTPRVNAHEINAWRFVAPDQLNQEISVTPEHFTPWFLLEWRRLQEEFWPQITRAAKARAV